MNESETRAEIIDPALKAAGWGVVEGSVVRREFRITQGRLQGSSGQRAKPEIADYVLIHHNTRLAVIEAKAWDKPASAGAAQAKSYAAKLAIRHAWSTNGQTIYATDMETGHEGELASYPGPDALWAQTFAVANAWRDRFAAVPFADKGGSWQIRFYQEIAVNRVLEKVAAGDSRILLTLATGTGKTSIAFQIAWKLFQSRWNLGGEPTRRPRILFLADRNTLASQAHGDFAAFSAFEDEALKRVDPASIREQGRVPKNASVFFTIFQTFMSGPPKDGRPSPYFGDYPPDFFDFIVIDECHRGGANDEGNWRGILDYFAPAVQLGLTATPKRRDNIDTYAYFGEPVYVYSLKDGINDGFLTPFRVRQIQTTLDDYLYTSDDQVIEGEVELGRRYEEADFNRLIEISERERYRVGLLMGMIDQGEKTLVFCASQLHALAVRDLINQVKTSRDPDYCVRVTAEDGARGDAWLKTFQDNEQSIPTILTTSQKLSTGVDARNVRNIVLMRPVNSMIEFKQIIGRGTRLYDDKDYFTIYDFVKAHHHFNDPEWDGEPIEPESEQAERVARLGTAEPKEASISEPAVPRQKLKIRLADGKERRIQHMAATLFMDANGRPMSAAQFLESLFGALPDFFRDEDELRTLWSAPDTRRALLVGLAEKGFGRAPLAEMQSLIEADDSDLYDVLAYVAFRSDPLSRAHRAEAAKAATLASYSYQQKSFIDFFLDQYVQQGVDELDQDKLTPLLKLKYRNAIADAVVELGPPAQIRDVFLSVQRQLYVDRRQPHGASLS